MPRAVRLPLVFSKQDMIPSLDKIAVPDQGIGDPLLLHDCKGDAGLVGGTSEKALSVTAPPTSVGGAVTTEHSGAG